MNAKAAVASVAAVEPHEPPHEPSHEARELPAAGWSLLVRLAWIATAAAAVSLCFGAAAMYAAASVQNDQILDARLEQYGATIGSLVEEELEALRVVHAADMSKLHTRSSASLLYRYQVWSRHGLSVMRSHESSAGQPIVPLARLGYSTVQLGGDEFRVFALPSKDGEYIIQVAENVDEAWSKVAVTSTTYASFLLIPFLIVMGATWWLLRHALRDVNALADQLARRNPLDLAPIVVASPPREIVPIVAAVDQLLARVQRALSIERSFTSRAAHEMRTPLAGVLAQAYFLRETGPREGEPAEALKTLIRGADRVSHMLDQMLDLAHVETVALSEAVNKERVAVAEIHHDVLIDIAPQIQRRRVQVRMRDEVAGVWCHGFAMTVLVRNLIVNAVKYVPEGGLVEVSYLRRGEDFMLTVDDNGPGIPTAAREHAFERFNRLGLTGADGVGLGLSIVLSVVALHGGQIVLGSSTLGGLCVLVSFPKAAASHGATAG